LHTVYQCSTRQWHRHCHTTSDIRFSRTSWPRG